MFFESLKTALRSLRLRLTLWNVAAGLLTGLGILVAVREGVRYTLLYDLDQVLREDLKEIELHFTGRGDYDWFVLQEEMNRKARGHDFHGWFVVFYGRDGGPAWSSVNAPTLPLPTEADKQTGQYSVDHYRLAYRQLPRELEEASAAAVGCDRRFIARDMAKIDRLVVIVGGVIVFISPIVGYLLAGRTTRILSNLIQKTGHLRPSELKERLPIAGTGDELDALARTINGLLDRIGDYLQQKHDFLANAAHELRTPLAAIRSSVEVALAGKRSEVEYQELLDEVIRQCQALQLLVNQLLLLSESDADRLIVNSEPFSFDELVASSVEMFRGVAEDRGLVLKCGPLPSVAVVGNRQHLRQVLNNLLDNAVKFTALKHQTDKASAGSDGGSGKIDVQLLRDELRGLTRLLVSDNGVGLAAEHVPHVFERFYRADRSHTRDGGASGTGLGLSICQAIVTAHQGTIQVTSQAGRGTTFTITLPLAPDVPQPAEPHASLEPAAGR
jgi:signal transduction histidine kinase